MFLSKVFSFALVALAHARPAIDKPTKIVQRDQPTPSIYPLGNACEHEWRYLNFDPDDNTDKAYLRTLYKVICSGELRAIASSGSASAMDLLAPYRRYFPLEDDDDDFPTHVYDVLTLIAGESSSDGKVGEIVETFIVDKIGKLYTFITFRLS